MTEQRDQILADFQACTGLEDVGECFMFLEQANWNLLDAVHNALPRETQSLPSEEDSVQRLQLIFRDRAIALTLPQQGLTCGDVRQLIAQQTCVPPCRQSLMGWDHVTDETPFVASELAPGGSLLLRTTSPYPEPGAPSRGNQVRLHIQDDTSGNEYAINFPGSKTILELKQDVSDLTSIPVRHQRWRGWPLGTPPRDETALSVALGGIEEHWLSVESTAGANTAAAELVSSDSSNADEFEDANECLIASDDTTTPLMPEGIVDEAEAVAHFSRAFVRRYGECSPAFFQGTLAQAIEASCYKPIRERRPLVLYLHQEQGAGLFCGQLLCSEAVVSYLALNFILWPWDLTLPSNRDRFLESISRSLGAGAVSAVRSSALDCLPALVVLSRVRGSLEVLSLIPGTVELDDLMTRLMQVVEVFTSEMANESREEQMREAREQVRREQDAAYVASLKADQEKDKQRQQAEQELLERESEAERQRALQRDEKLHQEELQKAMLESLAAMVPAEPPEDGGTEGAVTHLRVRLPSGEVLSRRFLAQSPLSQLLLYLASCGYPSQRYRLLSAWPRRDLSNLDGNKTLEELQLFPKETLTLEERPSVSLD
uniref:Putative regulator of the ubiquitin pathway n=1 Tax=Amblyomma cajennense TaxID=34607 RepID=A0A023FM42_AMBCJ